MSAHVSKSKGCFNAKSLTYYFYMKTNILADFQICISIPLIYVSVVLRALLLVQFSLFNEIKGGISRKLERLAAC